MGIGLRLSGTSCMCRAGPPPISGGLGVGGGHGWSDPSCAHPTPTDAPHTPHTAPHCSGAAPSDPPHPMRWGRALDVAVARRPSMGWPRSPYPTAHIALYERPMQRTAQEGEGGVFPAPTLSGPAVPASQQWTVRCQPHCDLSCPQSQACQ